MSKLYSPDGTAEVIPHPSKREQMINDGWTTERPVKLKPSTDSKKSADKKEDS